MRHAQEHVPGVGPGVAQAGRRLAFVWLGLLVFWGGSVFAQVRLPLDEYHELLRRAEPPSAASVRPAAPAALSAASIAVALDQTTATATTRLNVVVLAEGWQRVPIPATGRILSVEQRGSAADSGFEARLDSSGKGLLVRGVGMHDIVLREALPLAGESGSTRRRRELRLDMPMAASITGSIEVLPDDDVAIADGGVVVGQNPNRLDFVATPGATLTVVARSRTGRAERSDQLLRFSAQVSNDAHIWRTRATVEVRVWVSVLQGVLETLEFELPRGYEVEFVDAVRLSGWDVRNGLLLAQLLSPQQSSFQLNLRLVASEQLPQSGQFASPVVTVRNALRLRTRLSTTVHGTGILELADLGAAVELDRSAPPPPMPRANTGSASQQLPQQRTVSYQLTDVARPPQWTVIWPEQTEVLALRVDTMMVDALVGVDGRAVVNFQLQVANRGAQTLDLTLPEGFELIRCERDGRRTRPGIRGTTQLVLGLDGGAAQHRFSVVGVMPVAALGGIDGRGEFQLSLPRASAPITEVLVRAQLPDGWRYRLREPSLLIAADSLESRAGGGSLLDTSAGFVAVHAAWSAMSAQPGALQIDVLERRSREEWF